MILKRIAEGMKNQDWFVVTIEVMIVVVGIFIGLQVDDWNEGRKDKESEAAFLTQLHNDILLGQELTSRVLDRRIGLMADLVTAVDLVFLRQEGINLTHEQCIAIGDSRYVTIPVPNLTSLAELQSAGKLGIITDDTLRRKTIELAQKAESLKENIKSVSLTMIDLPNKFPKLISSEGYFDTELNEHQVTYECDLQGMRTDLAFRSGISTNIDAYDAYLRAGLLPWDEQFKIVHEIVDHLLGINHASE